MTPYDPQAIAREAAESCAGRILILTNRTSAQMAPQIEQAILLAAARMLRESGAREALEAALDATKRVADLNHVWDGVRDPGVVKTDARFMPAKGLCIEASGGLRAALANLAKLEGRG